MSEMLQLLIVAVGVLIAGLGVWGLARPADFTAQVDRLRAPGPLWVLAALRLGIGAVFLLGAAGTRWPTFVQLLGAVAVFSGLITPLFAGERLRPWFDWWTTRPPAVIRAWGVAALALGGAVIFAGT